MKFVLAAAVSLIAFSPAVFAEDMSGPGPIQYSAPAPSVYVQLLGGVVQDLDVTYHEVGFADDSAETKWGYAIAGTIGFEVMDGLSLEADVLHTARDIDVGFVGPDNVYSTTSLMANVKYTAHLNDTFSLYGGVGLGYVWGSETYGDEQDNTESWGYQLIAGVGAQFTENIAGVVEYRYQSTFDELNYTDFEDEGLTIPVSALLAGVKVGF